MNGERHTDLVRRLGQLERRQSLVGWLLALTVLGIVLTAAQDGSQDLQVRRLELTDTDGRIRAVLTVEDGQPALHLLDTLGVARASLVHRADETGLFLQDAEGDTRVGAAHFAHGGSGFALHGPGAKERSSCT